MRRQVEPGHMPFIPVANFCADLSDAIERADRELNALGQAGAVYRADALFEAGADLSDALVAHEQGRLGEDAVKHEALKVCRLAVLLWLTVVEEGDEDGR